MRLLDTIAPSPTNALEAHIAFLRHLDEHPVTPADWPPDMRRIFRGHAQAAETFYWTPALNELIESAALSLPGTMVLTKERLFARAGFCWFGKALPVPGFLPDSIHGDEVSKILVWGLTGHRESGQVYVTVNRLGLSGECAQICWSFGQSIDDAARIPQTYGHAVLSTDEVRRTLGLFGAMMLFLEQEILVRERVQASRGARRRAALSEERMINTILLRRVHREGQAVAGREVDWSCRWIVRGHWRNQWYPSLGSHQPVWIAPHVKGPEDRGLRVRRSLFAIAR